MDMNNGVGRSYKYYTGTPLYPFGFGLSYTSFELKWETPPPSPRPHTYTVTSAQTPSTTYAVALLLGRPPHRPL
jgi:hypothetical protein